MNEAIAITIPHETVNDESVRILSWSITAGSYVEKEQLICEIETSKAIMEIHATATGILNYRASVGDEIPVGSVICEITPSTGQQEAPERTASTKAAPETTPIPSEPCRFTPLARKLAAEHGIAAAAFPPNSLVRSEDIMRMVGIATIAEPGGRNGYTRTNETGSLAPKSEDHSGNTPVAGVPISWSEVPRKKIIEGRILAKGRAACIQSSVTLTCRATKIRARSENLGIPTAGLTALIIFEVSRLLRKHPIFNAVYKDGRIGQYAEVNIGWAIDGGQGLVVPVIKNADSKGLRGIASEMEKHIEDYISNSLSPSYFLGGTFTISDLSADGISYFHPLISEGQSAILGIGGELTSETSESPLYLTLAFDHQVAEGRSAAGFLRDLADRLTSHAEIEPVLGAGANYAENEIVCSLCRRDKTELMKLRAVLMKSDLPAGAICSLCLGGY